MKKLMLTTALASLVITGSAIAQTTITGEARVTYKAIGSEASTGTTTTSGRGFGTEQQINFANKGKLNVGGLEYAAGFSLENDGLQTTSLFNENTYMDITNPSSGTTISFSMDHIQRNDSDRSAGFIMAFAPSEYSSSGIGSSNNRMIANPSAIGQSQTASLLQKLGDMGTFSYSYAPTVTDQSTSTITSGSASSETLAENNEESGYEIGFTGSLGVKGLSIDLFKSKQEKIAGKTFDEEANMYGLRYSTGAITLGVAQKKSNSNTTDSTKLDVKERNYGLAYAINPNTSVGILHATADKEGDTSKQKLTAVHIGYNLGPVALQVGVARNTDIGGTNGQDSDVFMTRLVGAF
jgi:hypothetical protein